MFIRLYSQLIILLIRDSGNGALVDHVKMNSWCKFGACVTLRYCKMDLTISF